MNQDEVSVHHMNTSFAEYVHVLVIATKDLSHQFCTCHSELKKHGVFVSLRDAVALWEISKTCQVLRLHQVSVWVLNVSVFLWTLGLPGSVLSCFSFQSRPWIFFLHLMVQIGKCNVIDTVVA